MATTDPASAQSLWTAAVSRIEGQLGKPSFEVFVKTMRPLGVRGDTVTFAVPNRAAKDWIESRFLGLIQSELRRIAGRPVTVELTVSEGPPPALPSAAREPAPVRTIDGLALSPKYTFETFVVGSGNRFAHAAARAVAEAPGRAYNPLFIYGGVGLGKTHLLQAIGHHVVDHESLHRVAYVSSEKFTNELINSIRDDRMIEFRHKYRNVDVLLIDDIQFLAGKERTQEEFFHTFNTLHEATRQIIITSDKPPKEIPTLEERLRSRFEWGLIADIQPPDLETRIAILRKKAEVDGIHLPDEVAEFIAQRITTNIRELEGALVRVVAYATLTRSAITSTLAEEVLRELLPASRPSAVTIQAIQQAVADYFGIRLEEMRAKRRTKAVAFPRQVAMYLARELTDASLPRIGEAFGGRDHTTVMHACDRVKHALQQDPHLAASLKRLTERLQHGG
ncbi:MAG: chromosomal replication initiator protein DnaA [Armatimonadota bacterium]|nr:chromosomal replication initiator protein DnaA [Armatimonadota bacterium]MDR7478680.1 chromosomal replication initiator protein DnaA [Armatimonadota bacterium]MDR7489824.1 chromosomal replication initiator protein DnaA [Armatimonadota bacterium]MDR7500819.1 chromosomal replication initiator protein DnaA [Armatimonadota bacterium]MDR7574568.1 chromosomal replication initiator protein DnaA [Armatimonadota bacterium]